TAAGRRTTCRTRSGPSSTSSGTAPESRAPGPLWRAGRSLRLRVRDSRLELPDVGRLRTLRALRHLVLDLLAFGEAAETLHLHRGVVDEHVLATAVRRDEAVALRIVEPLHDTSLLLSHSTSAFRKRPSC